MEIATTQIADFARPGGRSTMVASGQQTNGAEQRRRRRPSLIDADWLVLRGLSRAIDAHATRLAGMCRSAIDLGCGEQPYRDCFAQRGIAYRGADLGDSAEIAITPDGRVLADAASADLVTSFQVLEHVRNLDTYLSEAARLLMPGGKLLLSTHGTWLYHPHPEDHRRWTREGLINELQSRGWKVESWEAICGPLAWTTIVRLTGYCYVLRRIPLVGASLAGMLALLMNLRAGLEDAVTPPAIRDDNACVYLVQAHFGGE
jgi:SAM-dependent methyltransferase